MASVPAKDVQKIQLSQTYETTQLVSPGHLERITIDDPHYQQYLVKKGAYSPEVLAQPKPVMGGSNFFVQSELPVPQQYVRTALQLSSTRPWDQVVDTPLRSRRILDKEVKLEFPKEHPYSSHTPLFAMFPDFHPYQYLPYTSPPLTTVVAPPIGPTHKLQPKETEEEISVAKTSSETQTENLSSETQTQTTLRPNDVIGIARPPAPYFVPQKASEYGVRVERKYLSSSPGLPVVRESGEMLMDLPRTQRHKKAYTYPVPSLQYGRPPTTPFYLPPPSTGTAHPALNRPQISQKTQRGIDTIHNMLARTTSYRDHFTPRCKTRMQERPDISLCSRQSNRPWTAESRGKYNYKCPPKPLYYPHLEHFQQRVDEESESEEDYEETERQNCQTTPAERENQERGAMTLPRVNMPPPAMKKPKAPEGLKLESISAEDMVRKQADVKASKPKVLKVDTATQTEDIYFEQLTEAVQPTPAVSINVTAPKQPVTDSPSQANVQSPLDVLTAKLYKLPLIDSPANKDHDKKPPKPAPPSTGGIQLLKRVGGYPSIATTERQEAVIPLQHSIHTQQQQLEQQSLSKKLYDASKSQKGGLLKDYVSTTPRSVEATRRMVQLYHGFNRSEVRRKFHQQYPEVAPDLRQFGITKGKRHTIHGYNAYYFH